MESTTTQPQTPTLKELVSPAELKAMKKGRLFHNHKFFVTSKAFPRAYKYFSSLNFYHAARKSSEQKFQSILNQIKYVKTLNIPMVLNTDRSHKIFKKLKFLNKSITHSTNLVSFGLSKGKCKGYQEKIYKNSMLISEVFITPKTSLHGLKYCRKLQTLRLDLQHCGATSLNFQFFRLLYSLKKLKSLFINTSSSSKESFAEFIACVKKRFPVLEELYFGIDKWFDQSEGLGLENLKVSRFSLRQNGFSDVAQCQTLLEILAKNVLIKELQFLSKSYYLKTWADIERFLKLYGFELQENKKTEEFKHPMTIEKPEYVLRVYLSGFTFIKK